MMPKRARPIRKEICLNAAERNLIRYTSFCEKVEQRQAAPYLAFAALLRQRDEADGTCRLSQEADADYLDTTE